MNGKKSEQHDGSEGGEYNYGGLYNSARVEAARKRNKMIGRERVVKFNHIEKEREVTLRNYYRRTLKLKYELTDRINDRLYYVNTQRRQEKAKQLNSDDRNDLKFPPIHGSTSYQLSLRDLPVDAKTREGRSEERSILCAPGITIGRTSSSENKVRDEHLTSAGNIEHIRPPSTSAGQEHIDEAIADDVKAEASKYGDLFRKRARTAQLMTVALRRLNQEMQNNQIKKAEKREAKKKRAEGNLLAIHDSLGRMTLRPRAGSKYLSTIGSSFSKAKVWKGKIASANYLYADELQSFTAEEEEEEREVESNESRSKEPSLESSSNGSEGSTVKEENALLHLRKVSQKGVDEKLSQRVKMFGESDHDHYDAFDDISEEEEKEIMAKIRNSSIDFKVKRGQRLSEATFGPSIREEGEEENK